jgi:uncharacterized membrane protein
MFPLLERGTLQVVGLILEAFAVLLLAIEILYWVAGAPLIASYSVYGVLLILVWLGMRLRISNPPPPTITILAGLLIALYPAIWQLGRLYEYQGSRPQFIEVWLNPRVPWPVYLLLGIMVLALGRAAVQRGQSAEIERSRAEVCRQRHRIGTRPPDAVSFNIP